MLKGRNITQSDFPIWATLVTGVLTHIECSSDTANTLHSPKYPTKDTTDLYCTEICLDITEATYYH